MTTPIIGIDLGTTNSLIAVFENGQSRLIQIGTGVNLLPSVVSFDGNHIHVGQAAKDRAAQFPSETFSAFKRNMGTNFAFKHKRITYGAVELSAMVLQKLKYDAEQALGQTIGPCVISVPAYFNQTQRKATMDAALIAGLSPLRLINEPTAAALAYGALDQNAESQFLVVDLGGGTFDVTLLNMFDGVMEVTASSGDAFLGGEDFTQSLAKLVAQKLGQEWAHLSRPTQNELILRADAAKTHFSVNDEFTFNFDYDGTLQNITITRKEFETACEQLIRRLIRPIERCLYDSGTNLSEIDRVILVGGATRMPMLRAMITRQLKKFPEYDINPDHAVALGAAIQAGLIAEDKALDDVVLTDVSPFSVGIESSRNITELETIDGLFSPIIERNQPLPASREAFFSTMHDNQLELRISVYQGEAAMVADNIHIGTFHIAVPRAAKGREGVNVRISYDTSGLIEVEAKSPTTGDDASIVITENVNGLDDAELQKSLKKLQKLKIHPKDDELNTEVMARLKRMYSMASGDDRIFIQNLLIKFKSTLDRQNPKDIEATRGEIIETLKRIDDFYVS